jgi:FG-GAP-like repeat
MKALRWATVAVACLAVGLAMRAGLRRFASSADSPEAGQPQQPKHVTRAEAEFFYPPVRLMAAGKVIDRGEALGHCGPAVADVDGDGVRDLVVGDYSGLFRFYRNRGTDLEPEYDEPVNLQAGGEDAVVPIYCCMGPSPQFVDFDGDGHVDLISGSYDPGELYLFRGQGKAIFGAREAIKDKLGRPIIRAPEAKDAYASFASWPALVDWEGDGDLDILVGTVTGEIFLRRDEGTRTQPLYAGDNEWVQAGGRGLQVPSGHASPAIADWDGDGRWDILSGAANGAVHFFRNTGTGSDPQFAAAVTLVSPHKGVGFRAPLDPGEEPKLGIRSQIAALDYDGDGKLDLLLGDYCSYVHIRANLTPQERREREELGRRLDEVNSREAELMRAAQIERMRGVPETEWLTTPENRDRLQSVYDEVTETAKYKELRTEEERLQRRLADYVERSADGKIDRSSPDKAHGFVWLLRRR